MRSKIVTTGMAGMLALSLCLAACGNSSSTNTATEESTESTTATTSSTEETTEVEAEPAYWAGPSIANGTMYFAENLPNGLWEVIHLPSDPADTEDVLFMNGPASESDGVISITDIESGAVVEVTIVSASDDEMVINVGGLEATLAPSTFDDLLNAEDAAYQATKTE